MRVKDNNGTIYHKNIYQLLNQFSMPDMQHYDIELGSATTRIYTQQKLANKYTKVIVEQPYNII